MTKNINNNSISEESIFYTRDYFLDAEGFFPEALRNSSELFNESVEYLREKYTNEELYEKCEEIMEKVETGQVKQEQMQEIEIDLTLLFTAIKEKELIKKLIKMPIKQNYR